MIVAVLEVAAGPFIRAAGTVAFSIADLCHVNAPVSDSWTLPLTGRAAEWWSSARVTVVLIRIVATVVLAVADHRVDDATRIITAEVILATNCSSALSNRLV